MSIIHYSATELANIVSALCVHNFDNRATLVKTMSEVASVNVAVVNAQYHESNAPVTAEEIEAEVCLTSASLERAIGVATNLVYNCDGLMNDRLRAAVGDICAQLARKALESMAAQRAHRGGRGSRCLRCRERR